LHKFLPPIEPGASRSGYKWRSRFGYVGDPDARKLKALEEENRKLKKLLA
jgi:hypothetical protein